MFNINNINNSSNNNNNNHINNSISSKNDDSNHNNSAAQISRRGFLRLFSSAGLGVVAAGATGSLLSATSKLLEPVLAHAEDASRVFAGPAAGNIGNFELLERATTVAARFFVGCDLHVGYGRSSWTEDGELEDSAKIATLKTFRAFDNLTRYAPGIDGILFAGDMVWANYRDERKELFKVAIPAIAERFETVPPIHFAMGNHDCWTSSHEQFESDYGRALARVYGLSDDAWQSEDLGQKQNCLTYVAGVPVIKLAPLCPKNNGDGDNSLLCDYRYLYDFLESSLIEAEQTCPGMPIVVLSHYGFAEMPVTGEYYGYYGDGSDDISDYDAKATTIAGANRGDMIELMARFPQVLFFSGHVHNDLRNDNFHYDGAGFNAFACGTLGAYIEDLDDDSVRDDSQGLLVDIYIDGSIDVHRLDFSNEEEILPSLMI